MAANKPDWHQWLNTILISLVGFIGAKTYDLITSDHEKLATHETRITVVENVSKDTKDGLNFLTGRVDVLSDYYHNTQCEKPVTKN